MTTVVAHHSHTAPPHSLSADSAVAATTRTASPLRYAPAPAPRMSQPNSAAGTPSGSANATPVIPASSKQQPARTSPKSNLSPDQAARSPPSGKPSPTSSLSRGPPKIRVKKEPASPTAATSRPRPRRLDLSASNSASRGPQTAGAPIASKESAGLAIKDLGVACLSPGFQTQDPTLREQLQRSLSVRDQQRQLIEARQKGTTKNIALQDVAAADAAGPSAAGGARKRGPPPGLSIHAPAAAAFANERVVQSAPLGQSFTGLRQHNAHPPPRSIAPTSQASHPPPPPPSNRLPPISDVFAAERMEAPASAGFRPAAQAPLPSPGHGPAPTAYSPGYPPSHYPPHHHEHHHDHHAHQYPPHHEPHHSRQPPESRPREFRSAEEAVHGMTGGREDLQPKLVHYGGAQPPTPPSPGGGHDHASHRDFSGHSHYAAHHPAPHSAHPSSYANNHYGRRRTRDEYEQGHDSPPREYKRAREEDDWRREMSQREKRDEFLRLCERAWDLFHS